MKCNNAKMEIEEFPCAFCDGTGQSGDYGSPCDVCGGSGVYLDACCIEHADEDDDLHMLLEQKRDQSHG